MHVDTVKRKNDDKTKSRSRSRLFILVTAFVIAIVSLVIWHLRPAPVLHPEFPASPLLYTLDGRYEMINLQTGERSTLSGPWDFVAPPDSPPDILAAQALIDEGYKTRDTQHLPLVPSPDNQWLIGWKRRDEWPPWDLMLYDQNGSAPPRSLGAFSGIDVNARVSWSPDSTSIVFDALVPDSGTWGHQELWLVETLTGEITQLTKNNVDDTGPDFSPDGTKILYNCRAGDAPHRSLCLRRPGTSPHVVVRDLYLYAAQPSWSPDGEWIAAIAYDPNSERKGVWVVSSDGTDAQLVAVSEQGSDRDAVEWMP